MGRAGVGRDVSSPSPRPPSDRAGECVASSLDRYAAVTPYAASATADEPLPDARRVLIEDAPRVGYVRISDSPRCHVELLPVPDSVWDAGREAHVSRSSETRSRPAGHPTARARALPTAEDVTGSVALTTCARYRWQFTANTHANRANNKWPRPRSEPPGSRRG